MIDLAAGLSAALGFMVFGGYMALALKTPRTPYVPKHARKEQTHG
jgi:hypothetical protein